MVNRYVSTTEQYKGFDLSMEHYNLGKRWHRCCKVFKDGEHISTGKTKKECKELIDGGYIK